MALPQAKKRYTPAEYYALERDAPYKSDYYNGEIFAMAGGMPAHSLIVMNVTGELRQRLKGNPCTVYESNLRLRVLATGLRTYPDVSIYCQPLELDPEDEGRTTATNPTILIEVLSPSTEAYDRGFKFDNYRQVKSLNIYVLVAQDRAHVDAYQRQPDGTWLFRYADGLGGVIRLDSINVDLPLSEIYDRVTFPETVSPPLQKD